MIFDTSFFEPLYIAECKKTYQDLVDYLIEINLDESFYNKLGIYYEIYHSLTKDICVPLTIHFLLHYYYGKENNNKYSLQCAWKIFQKNEAITVKEYYHDQLIECEKYLEDKFHNYESLYGVERSNKIKEKISYSMKNIKKDIIKKRNNSIKNYASKRPNSHNLNISKGKTKKIIDTKSQIIYDSIKDVSNKTGICISYIRECCKGKRKLDNYCFYYLKEFNEFTKDLI
jgi:hypothetical protein